MSSGPDQPAPDWWQRPQEPTNGPEDQGDQDPGATRQYPVGQRHQDPRAQRYPANQGPQAAQDPQAAQNPQAARNPQATQRNPVDRGYQDSQATQQRPADWGRPDQGYSSGQGGSADQWYGGGQGGAADQRYAGGQDAAADQRYAGGQGFGGQGFPAGAGGAAAPGYSPGPGYPSGPAAPSAQAGSGFPAGPTFQPSGAGYPQDQDYPAAPGQAASGGARDYTAGQNYQGGRGYQGGQDYQGRPNYPGNQNYAGGQNYPGAGDYATNQGLPAAQGYQAAPAGRARRRRRRWPWITLIVIIVLLIAADRGANAFAEDQMASQFQSQLQLSGKPHVTIQGFPFLTQLAAQDFNQVNINASNETAGTGGQLEIKSLTAVLHGMHIHGSNSATIDNFSASALVTFTALAHAGNIPGGITLSSAGGNRIKATIDLGPLGSGTAIAQVTQVGSSKINVKLIDAGGLPTDALGNLVNFTVSIPKLPAGVKIGTISVTSQGLQLSATGHNATFSH